MTTEEIKLEKMTQDVSDYIQNVIETAYLLNIDAIVIDDESIRGKSEDGVLILQEDNLPTLPFDSIAFGDLTTLKKRMNLFDDFTVWYQLKTLNNGFEYPFKIKIKSTVGKSNVDFRCMMPTTVRAPKRVGDPIAFSFMMNSTSVDLLTQSKRVMGSTKMLLSSKKGKVKFQISDDSGNILTHRITNEMTSVDKDDFGDSFVFEYDVQNMINILKYLSKQDDEFEISVTSRGFITFQINDLKIYILRMKE